MNPARARINPIHLGHAAARPAVGGLARGAGRSPRDHGPARQSRRRLHALIDDRRRTPPSNGEMQRHLGLSGAALHAWCRREYGLAPQRVALRRRLDWARERLRGADMAIARRAHEAGFADTASFSRAFRRRYGIPPSAAGGAPGRHRHADHALLPR